MEHPCMGNLFELPGHRDWFDDGRGDARRMQVTWHPELGFVVFSLWHAGTCTSTFRLPIEDAPRLISMMANSLGEAAATVAVPNGAVG
jgi:hypothetical protein